MLNWNKLYQTAPKNHDLIDMVMKTNKSNIDLGVIDAWCLAGEHSDCIRKYVDFPTQVNKWYV